MTGGVEEGDIAAIGQAHAVRPDVLRNAARPRRITLALRI